jgi:hypothetical protein
VDSLETVTRYGGKAPTAMVGVDPLSAEIPWNSRVGRLGYDAAEIHPSTLPTTRQPLFLPRTIALYCGLSDCRTSRVS